MEHGIEVNRAKAAFKAGGKAIRRGHLRGADGAALQTFHPHAAGPRDQDGRQVRRRGGGAAQAETAQPKSTTSRPGRCRCSSTWRRSPTARFPRAASNRPSLRALCRARCTAGAASVAYLVPWGGQAAGRLLTAALRQDLKVHSSDKPFTQDGVKFPAGSLIFKVAANPADLGERLARLARETGAEIYGTNSGWVDDGVNFGSRWVVPIKKPAIAIAWDTPAQSGSAGATRFVLERQYGYPVTPIRTAQLARHGPLQVPGADPALGRQLRRRFGRERHRAREGLGGGRRHDRGAGRRGEFPGQQQGGTAGTLQENALRDGDDKKPADKAEKGSRRAFPAPRSRARPISKRSRAPPRNSPTASPARSPACAYAPTTGSPPAWAIRSTPWWKAARFTRP